MLIAFGGAACTTAETGKPVSSGDAPAVTTSDSADPTTTATPTTSLPPRPKEIKLDSVEPCTLLTQPQLAELKVTRTRARASTSEVYRGAKECVLEASTAKSGYDYAVTAVTTEGAEAWLTGKRNVDAKAVSVAGYPAVRYNFKGASQANTFNCWTTVDVAQGQQLQVMFTVNLRDAFTLDQMCQMSEQAATLAMATLTSR
ncbi:DUF3558 domain-containing protein [Actinokineospora sp. NBRC 105648]|uniref:DUF3558 domain-containing protein n=1 Tax=Actinokineospora sp. NBRC 105648 TaxID=3032206 RepID=UPI0024A19D4D|nr:DUF3558 domain-containing protein [Actinokineospora sp. NBRC 105648]GLZ37594.1 hypothetical protein Acsp05_12190 [Actinokineospora sp. NBRC 105648]